MSGIEANLPHASIKSEFHLRESFTTYVCMRAKKLHKFPQESESKVLHSVRWRLLDEAIKPKVLTMSAVSAVSALDAARANGLMLETFSAQKVLPY